MAKLNKVEYCPDCGSELQRLQARGKWFCPSPTEECDAFDLKRNKMGQMRIVSRAGFSFHKMSLGRTDK